MAILLIGLASTGLLVKVSNMILKLTNFFLWLFTISMTDFGISREAEISIKIGTFIVTYLLVGIIFNVVELFDSGLMKVLYFIISTMIGFVLSWLVMIIQKHIKTIIVVGHIILSLVLLTIILIDIFRKRCNNEKQMDKYLS